jgi:hypothetical protein
MPRTNRAEGLGEHLESAEVLGPDGAGERDLDADALPGRAFEDEVDLLSLGGPEVEEPG